MQRNEGRPARSTVQVKVGLDGATLLALERVLIS